MKTLEALKILFTQMYNMRESLLKMDSFDVIISNG